jgi:hypothetical protein
MNDRLFGYKRRCQALCCGAALSLFVTADDKLLRIADAEGLATDDPENH